MSRAPGWMVERFGEELQRREPAALSGPRRLRERTGATLIDCAKALRECRGDEERAVEWLRARMVCR